MKWIDYYGLAGSDITLSFGGQVGINARIYGVVGINGEVNIGRTEIHLIEQPSVSESYRLGIGVGKYEVGLGAERSAVGKTEPMQTDLLGNPIPNTGTSISDMLSGKQFRFDEFISAGNTSVNNDFILEFGIRAMLGIDVTLNLSDAYREAKQYFEQCSSN